jgi:hypothetical protein
MIVLLTLAQNPRHPYKFFSAREYVNDISNTALTDLGLFSFFIQYHAKGKGQGI